MVRSFLRRPATTGHKPTDLREATSPISPARHPFWVNLEPEGLDAGLPVQKLVDCRIHRLMKRLGGVADELHTRLRLEQRWLVDGGQGRGPEPTRQTAPRR